MSDSAKIVEVVGGVIRRGGEYLLGRRPLGKSQGGKWEFIGGKIEPGVAGWDSLSADAHSLVLEFRPRHGEVRATWPRC